MRSPNTKTYLVTGGAGFIGSHFIRRLLGSGRDLHIINVDKLTYAGSLDKLGRCLGDSRLTFIHDDICNVDSMSRVFASYNIDYVVNFAAESHVDRSFTDPALFERTNTDGAGTLLQCALDSWSRNTDIGMVDRRFLQVSTDEVYGPSTTRRPFTERDPLNPQNPYSHSKAKADILAMEYFREHSLPVLITRSSNNFGPCQYPEKLIPLTIKHLLQGKPVPVYGDGLQTRRWLYVEDNCDAIDLVLHGGTPGEIYNVGSTDECTNLDLIRSIAEFAALTAENLIEHVPDRPNHDRHYRLDTQKIMDDLGWTQKSLFRDSLKKTVSWYLNTFA